jgi:hypothetical protein
MVKKGRTVMAAWALALAAGVSPALAGPVDGETGPNRVFNPGFELTSSIAGSGWTPSPGTLVEGVDYLVDTNLSRAHSGSRSFAGGRAGAPGFLSQEVPTEIGQSYNIHLWLANFSGVSAGTRVDVFWGGNLYYSASNIAAGGYREIVVDPIATSTFMSLSIGLEHDGGFLNIDDVSVRLVPVPEPASALLLALGLAGLVWRRRGRY